MEPTILENSFYTLGGTLDDFIRDAHSAEQMNVFLVTRQNGELKLGYPGLVNNVPTAIWMNPKALNIDDPESLDLLSVSHKELRESGINLQQYALKSSMFDGLLNMLHMPPGTSVAPLKTESTAETKSLDLV